MSLQQILIAVCMVLAGIGLGACMERHENKPRRDHRQPFRYWRP